MAAGAFAPGAGAAPAAARRGPGRVAPLLGLVAAALPALCGGAPANGSGPGRVQRSLAGGTAPARRASAVNVRFALTAQLEDSLEDVAESATEVRVRAGVTYTTFVIRADSGLLLVGGGLPVAKLVPYDLQATLQSCEEVTEYSGIPLVDTFSPFDGETSPVESTVEDANVEFEDVSFPYGGEFRLCYNTGAGWEELVPKIIVYGPEPLSDGLNFWCTLSNLEQDDCLSDASIESCQCRGKVEGMGLGDPPQYSMSRLMLADSTETCGSGGVFPFMNLVSEVSYFDGYEVHNFGRKLTGTSLGVWKLCYCVGYDANGAGSDADSDEDGVVDGACYSSSPADFPQFIGNLVTIKVLPMDSTEVTVYPTLRVNLAFHCGSDGTTPGGCIDTDEARYKIVRRDAATDLPYYDGDAGCQYLSQAKTEIVGAKVFGGHVAPANCESAVVCNDVPERLGPKVPTFNSVQIAASYQNDVMMSQEYDICYCDRNCLNSQYWFKAGTVTVVSVSAFFSLDVAGSGPTAASVNTEYYVVLKGNGVTQAGDVAAGSWSTEADGDSARELKILADGEGAFIDGSSCLTTEQPSELSGHQLVSGTVDYTAPSATLLNDESKPVGQVYGQICAAYPLDEVNCKPNIKLGKSGWYAFCYCDSNCQEATNWAVFGRQLIAGPAGGQVWTKYTGVTFDLTVNGYALSTDNRVIILSYDDLEADCGSRDPETRVYHQGESGAPVMLDSGTQEASITSMVYHASGTEISFSATHGLVDGDQMQLSSLSASSFSIEISAMYNNWHTVYVLCDSEATATKAACHKVVIPISFPAAEFPTGLDEVSNTVWSRSSTQIFEKFRIQWDRPTPEGRGYVVCWAPVVQTSGTYTDYAGPVGIIQAKNPIEMPEAKIGLTTVKPLSEFDGAPVLLVFTTGDISGYSDSTKQMQLVIAFQPEEADGVYEKSLSLRDRNRQQVVTGTNNDLSTANQPYCGQMILELWSSSSDGFPMPEGCFYKVDDSADDASEHVPELHIVFSRGNHLQRNTQYMIVLNAQVENVFTDTKFPIFLFSMDDVVSEPDGVVELGRLVPSPDYRVPPRDEENELVTSVVGQDPQWNGDVGFDIVADVDDTGATIFPELKRLKSFCIAFSLNFPDSTPSQELSCTECVTEADCGNYNADEVWCQSPIAANCLAPDETVLTDGFEAFTFKLRPQVDSPITARTVVRIFLRPLTQWNIAATCFVAFAGGACPAPATGGVCGNPACQSEAVAGGTPEIPHDLPFNTLRITLPDVMGDITSASGGVFMKVGSLSLPPGGFFPQGFSAELESETGAPDDWQPTSDNVKVYKTPKIVAASLVTADDPLVNTKPFRGDTDNKLYVRLVSGANLFANQQGDVKLTVISPFGYACATTDTFGGTVPDGLTVFDDKVPNTKGRFGGDSTKEELQFSNSLDPIGCAVTFKASMILYAMSVVYFEMSVDNPPTALQQNDESNVWSLRTEVTDGTTYTLDDYPLSGQTYAACASPQEKLYCIYDMGSDFGGSVSVLGLLSDVILQPFNFGASALNEMFVFFTTAQTVGTLDAMESEVWVDAPSTFDFGQYCSASHLPESYYIPEGKGTTPLPTGDVINCLGSLAASGELTYNRAKIKTTGRLLATTPYGFSVKVTNAPYYVLTQLTEWRIWTYTQSGVAVDGAYETARFNEMEDAGSDSWGIYQLSMPSANFGVTISDLRPSMDRAATDIIVFPIVVQTAMDLHVRILAPAEYIWDFQQDEFKYKAAGFGVASNLVVEGAEADLPINYGPNAPQTAPFNRITLDSIQTAWTPGVKYGFAAKIRLPRYPPTGSANYFCIEFGFDETYDANRLEAGVTEGPQIQTLINGGVSFTTSITSANTTITFSVQTITSIPVGGGIVIVGPPNFKFEYPLCSPKPAEGFPEMPYDSTCLFTEIVSTGQPKVSIVAGASGIPPGYYRFSLDATNPPIVRSQDEAGEWVIQTYSLVSEGTLLDYDTTIASFPIGDTMLYADLIMHTRAQELENQPCIFLTQAEQAIDSQRPVSTCDFEYWQFYSPQGYRDDRPGVPSQLIIAFKLSSTPVGTTSEIVVRAPEGYEFDIECDVVVDSTRIFDDSATTDLGQDSVSDTENLGYTEDENTFESRFAIWPATASVASCSGDANVARIIIAYGLESGEVTTDNPNPLPYVFRLGVVANPTSTPSYNKFVLEVNSATSTEFSAESSVPFDGVDIWSFKDVSIVQSTTAASTQALTIMNTVTITFRPVNSLPNGGHMRVLAPSSFAIPTVCDVGVELDAADMPVMESEVNQVLALKYSEFRDGDVLCQGDSTPSSRAKLVFVTDVASGKYLKGGLMYHVTLTVQNPQTTADVPEYWSLYSYEDTTTNSLIDSASFPGFTINAAVHAFDYVSPSSTNAHAVQVVTFSISFPSVVDFGESVRVVAPVSFYFGTIGDAICPQYAHLSGSLALTVPVCAANTITWTLEQETVPAYSPSTFLVQLRNPGTTPQTNMFQVRHLAADGSRKSSRIVSGFSIVPELVALAVSPTVPSTLCQETAEVVTGQLCQAAGSLSAVQVTFTPRQNANLVKISGVIDGTGESFDFSTATFSSGQTLYARSATAIVAQVDVLANSEATVSIVGIINPSVAGLSSWSMTTYTTSIATTTPEPVAACDAAETTGVCGWFPLFISRVDESLSKTMFSVYGYINVLESSQIYPIYLAETSATITFDVRAQYAIAANEILRVTRPIGYGLLEGAQVIASPSAPTLEVGESGVDVDLRWSTEWASPEDFYMVFTRDLAADDPMIFTFQCALPDSPQPTSHWYMRTYEVLPIYDYDGEVLDDSVQPYPWSGRDLGLTGTNDGAFPGFILVGQLPFTLETNVQTPSATVILTFYLDLSDSVDAGQGGTIIVDLEGPLGFEFEAQCLYNGYSAFRKCIGQDTVAELTTQSTQLAGDPVKVELLGINPEYTPEVNEWTAKLYTNDAIQYERYSVAEGYDIATMPVTYKGNNQIGEPATGFFTFTPNRASPTAKVYVVVTPPPNQGYNIMCTGPSGSGVEPLGFVLMPECTAGGANQPLTLMWENASIVAGAAYTFGVYMVNPGGVPDPSQNYFGVSLQYETETVPQAFDANMQVPGLDLKTLPLRMRNPGMAWSSSASQVLATVLLQVDFLLALTAGYISQIEIQAPAGIMYTVDTSAVKVTRNYLPLEVAEPVTFAGDLLLLNLDESQPIGAGTYNIVFEVSNPGSYPNDNTWGLTVYKDIDVVYTHFTAGYIEGQDSAIAIPSSVGGGAVRRSGGAPAGALCSLLAWAASRAGRPAGGG